VSGPFDMTVAPNAGGLFLGDYQGLASIGSEFVALLATANRDPPNRSDVHAVRRDATRLSRRRRGSALGRRCRTFAPGGRERYGSRHRSARTAAAAAAAYLGDGCKRRRGAARRYGSFRWP
jgi:hypothetical protein